MGDDAKGTGLARAIRRSDIVALIANNIVTALTINTIARQIRRFRPKVDGSHEPHGP